MPRIYSPERIYQYMQTLIEYFEWRQVSIFVFKLNFSIGIFVFHSERNYFIHLWSLRLIWTRVLLKFSILYERHLLVRVRELSATCANAFERRFTVPDFSVEVIEGSEGPRLTIGEERDDGLLLVVWIATIRPDKAHWMSIFFVCPSNEESERPREENGSTAEIV